MLLSEEKCWICWLCWGELEDKGESPGFPKNNQHIQHIQHFLWKNHIFIQQAPQNSTYSTVPLKEWDYLKNRLLSADMLICWILLVWGLLLALPKTFNIFNISAERSPYWFNMGPQNSTYSTFPLKEISFLRKSPFVGPLFLQTNASSVWFSFPPHPSLCPCFRRGRVRVGRGGGLEKGSLAGEFWGKGGFVFFCFGFVVYFALLCFVVGLFLVLFFLGFLGLLVLFFVFLFGRVCFVC